MSNEAKQKHYWQPWDEAKEERWNYLCQREQNGLLTESEKKEAVTAPSVKPTPVAN